MLGKPSTYLSTIIITIIIVGSGLPTVDREEL